MRSARNASVRLLICLPPAGRVTIRALPLASVDQPIQYPEVKPDAFRGIGGIATEPSPEGANIPHSVSQALQKVAGRQRGVDEPWIWQQEIDNPSSARP